MGRPLYSSTFRTTPAVREAESPCCEKWSYLNAFDPDSDEFFDNENAVYEDFIHPVTAVDLEEEDEDEDDEDDEARDMLVVQMGPNGRHIISGDSLRSNDSPLAVGAEDAAHLVVDAFHDIRQIEEGELSPMIQDPAVRVRLSSRTFPGEARWGSRMIDSGRPHLQRRFPTTAAVRSVSYLSHPQRDESLPVPTPSAPIPVPAVSRRTAAIDERVLPSPSTPPRQTSMTYLSMSPPPTSTPRLYSWARNPVHSASPSSGSPFTNPHARTSYAHLSPALIRIRDVTV